MTAPERRCGTTGRSTAKASVLQGAICQDQARTEWGP